MDNQPTPEFMLSLIRQAYRDSMGEFSYQTFISRLWKELDKAGVPGLEKVSEREMYRHNYQPYNYDASPHELKSSAVEAYFRLIRNGYVVEQPNSNFGTNPPSSQQFRWTARGMAWINDAQPVPEDSAAYMDYLKNTVGNLDAVVEQYVSKPWWRLIVARTLQRR